MRIEDSTDGYGADSGSVDDLRPDLATEIDRLRVLLAEALSGALGQLERQQWVFRHRLVQRQAPPDAPGVVRQLQVFHIKRRNARDQPRVHRVHDAQAQPLASKQERAR